MLVISYLNVYTFKLVPDVEVRGRWGRGWGFKLDSQLTQKSGKWKVSKSRVNKVSQRLATVDFWWGKGGDEADGRVGETDEF